MTLHAKTLTNTANPVDVSRGTRRQYCRDAYTVPVKSAAHVIAWASQRTRPMDLCEAAGLDPGLLNDADARIPLRQLVALYEAAARLTREPAFGLRLGEKTDFRTFELFGYVIMNSATLEEALSNAVRYFPLWTAGASFRLERDGSGVRFAWEYADPGVTECRQDCEMTLAAASKIGRLLTCELRLREVHFQHSAPRDVSGHRQVFGASVHFRMPANALIFDRHSLTAHVQNADPQLYGILVCYAENLLADAHVPSLADRAQLVLQRSLRDGDAQLANVARKLGRSSRTLQRQLQSQGWSFRGLLNNVRRHAAEQYLRDGKLATAEIAYLLGYSEVSEFHRAFRNWTGFTPRQFRSTYAT